MLRNLKFVFIALGIAVAGIGNCVGVDVRAKLKRREHIDQSPPRDVVRTRSDRGSAAGRSTKAAVRDRDGGLLEKALGNAELRTQFRSHRPDQGDRSHDVRRRHSSGGNSLPENSERRGEEPRSKS